MSARIRRIDQHKAGIQLLILYNAVRKGDLHSEAARNLLLAMIVDIAEAIGVDLSRQKPDLASAARAMGGHARQFVRRQPKTPVGAR